MQVSAGFCLFGDRRASGRGTSSCVRRRELHAHLCVGFHLGRSIARVGRLRAQRRSADHYAVRHRGRPTGAHFRHTGYDDVELVGQVSELIS
jgi:hypothetical protein